ncbi:hypothetical protein [Gemmobacter sp. 24YEA27]|uniref:hypothetical protein n=1 Tax=Gemmobacter sp. 24YEA27 TaxID=3040672 RepID=UPI0024B32BBB|nr:hypothetical protein [Gemmobacter sp. 24YEA27]
MIIADDFHEIGCPEVNAPPAAIAPHGDDHAVLRGVDHPPVLEGVGRWMDRGHMAGSGLLESLNVLYMFSP